MKAFKNCLLLVAFLCMMVACHRVHPYEGVILDEFGNRFELNQDQSATIEFVNTGKVIPTSWGIITDDSVEYAAIAFNGDPAYFLLKKGDGLYRSVDHLKEGRCKIAINYEDN